MKQILGVLACAAILAAPIGAAAQQRAAGVFATVQVGNTFGTDVKIKTADGEAVNQSIETKGGLGIGAVVGFNFTPNLSVYGLFNRANQDIKNSSEDLDIRHLGIGGRFRLPVADAAISPYLLAEFGQRKYSGRFCDFGECADYEATGMYFGGGVGALYPLNPAFALDASLSLGFGNYGDYELGGFSGSLKTDNSMTTRLHVGFTWFPMQR